MFTIVVGTQQQLHAGIEAELAAYRYKVFVEHLGWDLPITQVGAERDEFDRPDTLYVMVKDGDGAICGCARLLPTTSPYLLASMCPALMGNQAPPSSAEVWELSRYTTQLVTGQLTSREEAADRFRQLLQSVCEAAYRHGARRLISFSLLGVERIARNFGIHVHRVGPAQRMGDKAIVAFWVELDEQTFTAFGVPVPQTVAH